MTSLMSESVRIIDKFNAGKFNLWKFKIEMYLAYMNLWDIVDRSEEHSSSNVDPKVLNEYQKWIKKTMFVIGFNWWTIN